jgi:RNA polymerase sigma-70 factor (ECF subfamily)
MQPREPKGQFDVRYAAFLETIVHIRAPLHRYCARMTGSLLDGEDVVQETLFEAYRKIQSLDDPTALRSWLFRIAHNRCIDFLRNRRARERAEEACLETDIVSPEEPVGAGARHAIERLVINLPPMERACLLMKDVFDYSLDETADLVNSTVGGVKAALSRGRAKLASLPADARVQAKRPLDPQAERLLHRYIELFNCRDWDGVRALTSADAQLQVADCFNGLLAASPYFIEYERAPTPWKFELGELDGEAVLIVMLQRGANWELGWPVRVRVANGLVVRIRDYYACPWVMAAASSITVSSMSGQGRFDGES